MQKKGLFYIPSRGVIAKRLGGGLQNRSDRFDSDSRLHFFVFFSEIVSNPRKKQILTLANLICPSGFFLFALVIFCGLQAFVCGTDESSYRCAARCPLWFISPRNRRRIP